MSNIINTDTAKILFPGYRVIKPLGEGGMGKVYLAEDERLRRQVAIKVLHQLTYSSLNTLNEARATAQINHPNVVQIYDIVEKDGRIAMVMEYLQGETLASFQRKNLLSLEQKLSILIQICRAINAIHKAGIIHADIKASNILITAENTIKVLDLGIARPHTNQMPINQEVQNDSASFGSFDTASPEHLRGETLDCRSDIYSFGALAFHLLSGRAPFQAHTTSNSSLPNAQRGIPEEAKHIFPALPLALVDLLNQMLAEDKTLRPEGFHNVESKLNQIQGDLLNTYALEQVTAPLPISEFKTKPKLDSTIKKSRLQPLFYIMLMMLGVCIIIYTFLQDLLPTSATKPTEHFVAVLRPNFIANEQITTAQKNLIVATIDDAVRQTILDSKSMHLLSRHETFNTEGNIKEIGTQLAATDIISTDISCTKQRCEIRIDLITDENWSVVKQKQWFISNGSAFSMYQEIRTLFMELLPQNTPKDLEFEIGNAAFDLSISSDQYQSFAELYARIMIQGEHNQEMLDEMEKLIAQGVSMVQVYDLYRWLSLKLYDDRKDASIITSLQSVLDNAPPLYQNSVSFVVNRFWLSLYQGDIKQAEQAISMTVARGAPSYQVLEIKAAYHLQNNEFDIAANYYKQLLTHRLNPKDLYNLALCYWYTGETEKALSTLNQLIKIHATYYPANQLLASLYLLQGNITEAIEAYKRLIADNAYSMDLNNLAIAYMLQREYQKAQELLERAVQQSPNNPALHLNLADTLKLLGNNEASSRHHKRVIELYSTNNELGALLDKAQSNAHLGNAQEAISLINLANNLAPNNDEVAFISSLVYQALGEPLFAITKAEQAIQAGMGSIWFTLPWFDSLCPNIHYRALFSDNLNAHCNSILIPRTAN